MVTIYISNAIIVAIGAIAMWFVFRQFHDSLQSDATVSKNTNHNTATTNPTAAPTIGEDLHVGRFDDDDIQIDG
jgi:hypothetical protein